MLDDLCIALENKVAYEKIPPLTTQTLCPLIELLHKFPEFVLHRINRNEGLQLNQFSELAMSLLQSKPTYRSEDRNIEYSSLSLFSESNTVWIALAIAIKNAAIRAGFANSYSGQFAGAIAELHDNIVEHSEYIDTGYVVFSSSPSRFEFVVADKGVGVLKALRNNPEYSELSDAGLALEKALTYGVSGTGKLGHGTGFKPTVEGLANIAHWMRFRSDDHGREYLRESGIAGDITARTSQKVPINGFVVSVSCDASMN